MIRTFVSLTKENDMGVKKGEKTMEKTNGMTMMEVQAILGNVMNQLMSEGNDRYKKEVHERAEFIAKIAKQMVNNADIVLRADKMCNRNDRINAFIGE